MQDETENQDNQISNETQSISNQDQYYLDTESNTWWLWSEDLQLWRKISHAPQNCSLNDDSANDKISAETKQIISPNRIEQNYLDQESYEDPRYILRHQGSTTNTSDQDLLLIKGIQGQRTLSSLNSPSDSMEYLEPHNQNDLEFTKQPITRRASIVANMSGYTCLTDAISVIAAEKAKLQATCPQDTPPNNKPLLKEQMQRIRALAAQSRVMALERQRSSIDRVESSRVFKNDSSPNQQINKTKPNPHCDDEPNSNKTTSPACGVTRRTSIRFQDSTVMENDTQIKFEKFLSRKIKTSNINQQSDSDTSKSTPEQYLPETTI